MLRLNYRRASSSLIRQHLLSSRPNNRIRLSLCLSIVFVYSLTTNESVQNFAKNLNIKSQQQQRISAHNPYNCSMVFQLGSKLVQSDLVVVSIYMRLNKSKHGDEAYREWMKNYFSSASTTPLLIFTDSASKDFLITQANQTQNPKTVFVFGDIWQIMKLIEQERNNNNVSFDYRRNYEKEQVEKDPERKIHSAELYAIWNAKPFLLRIASSEAFFNRYASKYFIYTDIGAFRRKSLPRWPSVDFSIATIRNLDDRVLFSQISPKPGANLYSSMNHYLQGGFFAGSVQALKKFSDSFYEIHDDLMSKGYFIGKDQMIINVISLEAKYADSSCRLYIEEMNEVCFRELDVWFLYQHYFASFNSSHFPANSAKIKVRVLREKGNKTSSSSNTATRIITTTTSTTTKKMSDLEDESVISLNYEDLLNEQDQMEMVDEEIECKSSMKGTLFYADSSFIKCNSKNDPSLAGLEKCFLCSEI